MLNVIIIVIVKIEITFKNIFLCSLSWQRLNKLVREFWNTFFTEQQVLLVYFTEITNDMKSLTL